MHHTLPLSFMWLWEQYLQANKMTVAFGICMLFQSLLQIFTQAEGQVWINDKNNFRTIHWWTMKFYIKRKTNFCSGPWVPIHSQKIKILGLMSNILSPDFWATSLAHHLLLLGYGSHLNWTVFVVRLTNERRLPLLLACTVVRNPRRREPPACRK